ncbi:hypothetical protein SFR_0409 [Streptomyces sp. FR-008]|nr:hypothetical protein SFR_0409 [Streptomyces sp. FR-008]
MEERVSRSGSDELPPLAGEASSSPAGRVKEVAPMT